MKTGIATTIFRFRLHLLAILALFTVFMGVRAGRLEFGTDFEKMIPLQHEYMQNYHPFKSVFGGGNVIRVSVTRSEETILDAAYIEKLRQIHEDVYFVKGIDRRTVRSIASPDTLVVIITEEGFSMDPVVPLDVELTDEVIAQVGRNIELGGLRGRLVGMDLKAALISGEVFETGVDYLSVYRQLKAIRDKYSDEDITVRINGFAMVAGIVNDALPKVVLLFGAAVLITLVILYRCFRYWTLAVLPLLSGGLAVLYSLGTIQLLGLKLDPMTSIIPFLVLAIGASHGIQMVKRYLEQCIVHSTGYDAALHALAGLLVPGTVALATDVIGFLTIYFIPIGVIRDLAVTASLGVGAIIITNILVLTLVLSFFPNLAPAESEESETRGVAYVKRLLDSASGWAHGKRAYWVVGVSAILVVIGFTSALRLNVGDLNPGEPILWEDSVYNVDAASMVQDYMFGIDSLSVVIAGDEPGMCYQYDTLKAIEAYETEIGNVEGVTVVISALTLARAVNETFREGDIRWRALPKLSPEIAFLMTNVGSNDENIFFTQGCPEMNIIVYLSDHKGDTIRRVIGKTKEFMARHPIPGARMLLAGGNVGVMAATNEEVGDAQFPMMGLIFLSVFIFVALVFRSARSALFVMVPLFIVSMLSATFMKAMGLGLNVNSLPVSALGVGVGVDYSLYFLARLKAERERQACFADAVSVTFQTTGMAIFYTALTLSAGVLTWLPSALKFQADMGLLLGFLFLANAVGAMIILPALVYVFDTRAEERKTEGLHDAGERRKMKGIG